MTKVGVDFNQLASGSIRNRDRNDITRDSVYDSRFHRNASKSLTCKSGIMRS